MTTKQKNETLTNNKRNTHVKHSENSIARLSTMNDAQQYNKNKQSKRTQTKTNNQRNSDNIKQTQTQ